MSDESPPAPRPRCLSPLSASIDRSPLPSSASVPRLGSLATALTPQARPDTSPSTNPADAIGRHTRGVETPPTPMATDVSTPAAEPAKRIHIIRRVDSSGGPTETPMNTPANVVNSRALMRARAANAALISEASMNAGKVTSRLSLRPRSESQHASHRPAPDRVARAGTAPAAAADLTETEHASSSGTFGAGTGIGISAAPLRMPPRSSAAPRLGPVSAAACNRASLSPTGGTVRKVGFDLGSGALPTTDKVEEEDAPSPSNEQGIDPQHEAEANANTTAEAKEEETSVPALRKRRRKSSLQGDDDLDYEDGDDACCVSCCALLVAICWLFGAAAAVLLPRLHDGFTVNEIDYWYPVRLCPLTASADFASYNEALNYAFGGTCSALTDEVAQCGSSSSCESNGCTFTATASEQACQACCGEGLSYHYKPCIFPFRFSNGNGRLVRHSACALHYNQQQSSVAWCPTNVTADLEPQGRSGACNPDCTQLDFVSSVMPSCTAQCPAGGATESAQTIVIHQNGWGGDSGMRFGAPYHLVLFSHGQYLELDVTLRTSRGRTLYEGNFSHYACTRESAASARRLTGGTEHQPGLNSTSDSDASDGPPNRRSLLQRSRTWWQEWGGGQNQGSRLRQREGDAARWAGASPVTIPSLKDVQCAQLVESKGTSVYLEGGCEVVDIERTLPYDVMRAELGQPFSFETADMPLRLTVSSVRASLRGNAAAAFATDAAGATPAIYFSLYTGETDDTGRKLLYYGVPSIYLLLSCCCCCAYCACVYAREVNERSSGAARDKEFFELTTTAEGGWQRRRMRPPTPEVTHA